MKREFSRKNIQRQNAMKIRPVEVKLFHADRKTDRHDEANSHFFAILRTRPKITNDILDT
jgi:hypothetical protein